jgi:hypothetical protein
MNPTPQGRATYDYARVIIERLPGLLQQHRHSCAPQRLAPGPRRLSPPTLGRPRRRSTSRLREFHLPEETHRPVASSALAAAKSWQRPRCQPVARASRP